jgi:hypothetical protein
VAGYENYLDVKYWKNGIPIVLTHTPDYGSSRSIFISNNDVYVAGNAAKFKAQPKATYWKNSHPVTVSQSSDWSTLNGIFVSCNDVYVAGYENGPTYWKNGHSVHLSHNGTLFGICVSGSDLFLAGYEPTGLNNYFYVAKYWKNGHPVNLTNGLNDAIAYSIFVTN